MSFTVGWGEHREPQRPRITSHRKTGPRQCATPRPNPDRPFPRQYTGGCSNTANPRSNTHFTGPQPFQKVLPGEYLQSGFECNGVFLAQSPDRPGMSERWLLWYVCNFI